MKTKDFIQECQKWDVFKKLSIYIVTSWLLIQVVATTKSGLNLPDKIDTYLILLLLIGLPFYAFYVWRYQIAPFIEKSVDDPDALDIDLKYKQKFYRIYMAVLGSITALIAIICIWLVRIVWPGPEINLPPTENDKIAVLKFGNNIGSEKFNNIGKMTAEWIGHGITQYKAGQVVSQDVIDEYYKLFQTNTSEKQLKLVKDYIKPSKVVKGNFYVNNEQLIIQCSITDGTLTNTLISFEQAVCNVNNAVKCVDEVKQRVISYLLMDNDSLQKLNLQEAPPKFDAYQYKLNALEVIAQPRKHLNLLNKSIEADSNYFEPKVLKIAHYYNYGDYKTADSLLNKLNNAIVANPRQRNLLDMYKALLDGNNKNAYKYLSEEYEYAPFDIPTNQSMMAIALQFVNKPEDVDKFYNELPIADAKINRCTHCKYRIFIKALADIEGEYYSKAIEALEPLVAEDQNLDYKTALVMAYVRSDQMDKVYELLNKIDLIEDKVILQKVSLNVHKELFLMNKIELANNFADRYKTIWKQSANKKIVAQGHYAVKDYNGVISTLEELMNENPISENLKALLAIGYYNTNQLAKATAIIEDLQTAPIDYDFGVRDYAIAQYYSAINEDTKALISLKKAVAAGFKYTPSTFQNDPHFKKYQNYPEFKEVMQFWH